MPLSTKHEAFAQARAAGARLDDACGDAGFTPGNSNAGRLADRRGVAKRIAGILSPTGMVGQANVPAPIASLSRIAKASEALRRARRGKGSAAGAGRRPPPGRRTRAIPVAGTRLDVEDLSESLSESSD